MKLHHVALSAVGAFLLSGPLQHVGALPQSAVGDASKAAIKSVLNMGATEAFAQCAGIPIRGNNGVGNGIDPQPPGNPPINDGPGTGPGNPGNRGGANR